MVRVRKDDLDISLRFAFGILYYRAESVEEVGQITVSLKQDSSLRVFARVEQGLF